MPIDFHAEQNRYTYAAREADPAWRQAISEIAAVARHDACSDPAGY